MREGKLEERELTLDHSYSGNSGQGSKKETVNRPLDRHNLGATFFSCILPIIKLLFLFPFIYLLSLSLNSKQQREWWLIINSLHSNPNHRHFFSCSFQFSSVTQSYLTLCDPVDCSTPGFPVHHQFPELAQTHVHRVSDAIGPSLLCHPLLLLPSLFPNTRLFSVNQFFS